MRAERLRSCRHHFVRYQLRLQHHPKSTQCTRYGAAPDSLDGNLLYAHDIRFINNRYRMIVLEKPGFLSPRAMAVAVLLALATIGMYAGRYFYEE